MTGAGLSFEYSSGVLADRGPVLVVGDTLEGRIRGQALVQASGLRLAAADAAKPARERLLVQPRISAIWIELDRELDDDAGALLSWADRNAQASSFGVAVSITTSQLDEVVALLADDTNVDLIIDGSNEDRLTGLALAYAGAGTTRSLSEMSADRTAARLRELTEEVGRIASTLARLSTSNAELRPSSAGTMQPPPTDMPAVSADSVREVIRARRLRCNFFPEDLFADPAWDMLLDLLQAEIVQHRVPVSSLCIAAAVPPTTALRWIKAMTDRGFLLRRDDPHDGRRVFIEMAPQTSASIRRYFAEVGKVGV